MVENLKGGGHGNFHNTFFDTGDAETQNNILKIFKVVTKCLHYNGFFRLQFFRKKCHGGYTQWSAIDFTVKARL